MSEFEKPEMEITKDEAMSAYKKFVDKGITTPDKLDLDDPEVIEANKKFDQWRGQEDKKAAGNPELELRNDLNKTMFYVDAGFTDKDYLEEVLDDWLAQDTLDVGKQAGDPERIKTRDLYSEATKKIRNLLKEKSK